MNNSASLPKTGRLAIFMKALWLYLAGILGVITIFYLLTSLEQGIDVVIQVGEHIWPAILSLVCVVSWVFLVWYSSRMVGYAKNFVDDTIPVTIHRHIPRLIAINCFAAIQSAIFALPTLQSTLQQADGTVVNFYHLHSWGLLLFIVAHNVLYYLLVSLLENDKKGHATIKIMLAALLVGAYLIWMVYCLYTHWHLIGTYKRHPVWLTILAFVLFIFEICAIILFVRRRKAIDQDAQQADGQPAAPTGLISFFAMKQYYKNAEAGYFLGMNIIAVIAVALFIVAISWLSVTNHFGTIGILLLSFGLLIGFFNLITYISIRVRFNINFLLWVWAFIIGLFYDPYTVKRVDSNPDKMFGQRPSSKEYFHKWLLQREHLLKTNTDTFEVYIVLSNGGASRSGDWVSDFLCKMQDSSFNKNDTNGHFSDHLLCMAGASGGSIGNCVFYSLLKAQGDGMPGTQVLYPHSNAFFSSDFLSYTLGHLTGPDFFRHVIPFVSWRDRATSIEAAMEEGPDDTLMNNLFNRPISQVFDTSGKLPILFINSTRVNDGMPAEVSSVKLPQNSQRIDILKLLDTCNKKNKTGDMMLATAAMLSARFPYVSPAGSILNNYFVDGGYFDNSGGGIVREFMDELKTILSDKKDTLVQMYSGRLHFTLIHIYNGSAIEDTIHKPVNPLVNDLFTPFLTLAGIQGSSTKVSDGSLEDYFRNFNNGSPSTPIKINLYDSAKTHEEEYPMSWVISAYNLERMRLRCDTVVLQNKDLLTRWRP